MNAVNEDSDPARSVELLWGVSERSARGPRPGLTREQIVAAAIAVADADGLASLSMARVAQRLGFTAMSLYRYVPGKTELIDLMVEHAVGDPPDLGDPGLGWRAQLERWARANLAIFEAHPWALPVVTRRRVLGPREFGWLEAALAALTDTGMDAVERFDSVLSLNSMVRGAAQLVVNMPADGAGDRWKLAQTSLLERLTTDPRFPAMQAAVAGGGFPSTSSGFEVGLGRLLDGIEARVATL